LDAAFFVGMHFYLLKKNLNRAVAAIVLKLIVLSFFFVALPMRAALAVSEWTTMIYIAGDNTLDRYVDQSLEWIRSANSSSENNVLVLVSSRIFTINGVDVDSDTLKCYRVSGGAFMDIPLTSINPSWSQSNGNLGDPSYLVNFATYCAANYPAKKYFLVIWSHGNGWWPKSPARRAVDFFQVKKYKKGVSYDDHNSSGETDYITTKELGEALGAIKNFIGKKISLVGFDACLMAQTEVMYEIRDSVDYVVASQELTPATGWKYDGILNYISSNPSLSALDIAKKVADIYDQTYSADSAILNYTQRTISVVDVSKMDDMAAKIKTFADELKSVLRTRLLYLARDKVEYFGGGENYKFGAVDLYDCAYLIKNTRGWQMPYLVSAASDVMDAVSGAVVYNKTGEEHPHARGLSINFPKTRDDYLIHNNPPDVSTATTGNYDALSFSAATGWNSFLRFYTEQIAVFEITGVSDVVAAPSPFNPSKELLRIMNFPKDISGLKIKIYDLSGELLRILDQENSEVFPDEGYALWDGKNESGRDAGVGIYFWRAESSNYPSRRGRLYLVR